MPAFPGSLRNLFACEPAGAPRSDRVINADMTDPTLGESVASLAKARNCGLDDCALWNHAALGDDNYAVADEEAVAINLGLESFIEDLNARPDARVLVDDCTSDEAVGTDADSRISSIY